MNPPLIRFTRHALRARMWILLGATCVAASVALLAFKGESASANATTPAPAPPESNNVRVVGRVHDFGVSPGTKLVVIRKDFAPKLVLVEDLRANPGAAVDFQAVAIGTKDGLAAFRYVTNSR